MDFAWAILAISAVCLVATALRARQKGRLATATPALIFFVLSIVLYSARIIDGLDTVLNAHLYNDLSNALRIYSCFVFVAYAWMLCP